MAMLRPARGLAFASRRLGHAFSTVRCRAIAACLSRVPTHGKYGVPHALTSYCRIILQESVAATSSAASTSGAAPEPAAFRTLDGLPFPTLVLSKRKEFLTPVSVQEAIALVKARLGLGCGGG